MESCSMFSLAAARKPRLLRLLIIGASPPAVRRRRLGRRLCPRHGARLRFAGWRLRGRRSSHYVQASQLASLFVHPAASRQTHADTEICRQRPRAPEPRPAPRVAAREPRKATRIRQSLNLRRHFVSRRRSSSGGGGGAGRQTTTATEWNQRNRLASSSGGGSGSIAPHRLVESLWAEFSPVASRGGHSSAGWPQ